MKSEGGLPLLQRGDLRPGHDPSVVAFFIHVKPRALIVFVVPGFEVSEMLRNTALDDCNVA